MAGGGRRVRGLRDPPAGAAAGLQGRHAGRRAQGQEDGCHRQSLGKLPTRQLNTLSPQH